MKYTNHKILLLLLTVGAIQWLISCGSASSTKADFGKLESELENLQIESSTTAEFSKSNEFKKLLRNGNHAQFLDAANQSTMPLVCAAGVLALAKDHPDEAYMAAVKALVLFVRPEVLYWGALADYLDRTPPPNDEAFVPSFEDIMTSRVASRYGLALIATNLPMSKMTVWLKSDSRTRNINNECTVLGVVYAKAHPTPDWLEAKLDGYKDHPGIPLSTYLYYKQPADSEFKSLLLNVLQDPTLDEIDISTLTNRRRGFIKRDIDVDALKTTPERISLIHRLIDAKR